MSPVMSMKTRVDGIVSHTLQHLEIGEFQLPLLVLSTDSTSRMLMETENAKEAPQTPATPTPSRTNSLII